MNESILEKISNVIEIPDHLGTLKEIINQDLIIIKGINEKKASILKNILKISTIGEFAEKEITDDNYQMLISLGIDLYDLNIWLFISKVINENKIEQFLGPQKVSIVGLNYAGKTAISKIMKQKLNLDVFINDTPTMGVKYEMLRHQTLNKMGLHYVIVDMGGQNQFRKEYIQSAEKYFVNISLLIFVIDVQDPEHFNDAIEYFKDVLKILDLLKENPEILVIINKVDPDIKNKKEIKDSINLLRHRINKLFKDHGKNFKYEINEYSIFDSLGDSQTIINEIRNFADRDSSKQPIERSFNQSYGKILDMFLELRTELGEMLFNIESKVEDHGKMIEYHGKLIEDIKKSSIPAANIRPLKTDINIPPQNIKSLSETINEELKKLIKRRKRPVFRQ